MINIHRSDRRMEGGARDATANDRGYEPSETERSLKIAGGSVQRGV